MISHQAILDFWFGEPANAGAPCSDRVKFWFRGGPEVDEEIRRRFAAVLEQAARGELDHWRGTPDGTLALIVVLDQFPRNMFRGSAQAYAFDRQAQALCLQGLARGLDASLGTAERAFFYMPLEHAEDSGLQQQSLAAFTRLRDEAPPALKELCKGFWDYALRHREVVERFGRFPHRNDALGRPSTAEEIEFLKQPGSSF